MTINHHLDDATLLAYAAGTLDEALSVVAASHMAWCGRCRAAVRRAEALGGAMLEELPAEVVSASCRSATLAELGGGIIHRFSQSPAMAGDVPAPLQRLLGNRPLAELPWKRKAPGVSMVDLPVSKAAKGSLRLMSIAPGKAMPEHGHGGEELTMILSGAYRDEIGRFARGDVADLDEEIEHRPIVENGMQCICLVATEAPTRFKSVFARILQPLVGI